LGDRFGHRKIQYLASAIGTLGCLLLLMARTPQTLLIFGGVVGIGIGLFLTANWALVNRLAPLAEAGVFLGLTNLATAGSGAVGRLLGPIIDLLNNANPGAFAGYTVMFIFGAVCTCASALLLARARETQTERKSLA
jgi:MFS family permease